jgi:hypothetical protein
VCARSAKPAAGNIGLLSSVTTGADGLGLISYMDTSNSDLKVAHCNDLACRSTTTTTVDSPGLAGWYSSVTIGPDGLDVISYGEIASRSVKVAHCSNVDCNAATTTTVDSVAPAIYNSVTIGADGST